jgi:hypothetical protein
VCSKILEKIAHNQILDFLSPKDVIDHLQSGFRKLHSTGTALLKIAEDIRISMFKGNVTLMVFLDFTKAFDMVNHDLLLKKLAQLNFSDPALNWLKSYLTNRRQAAKDSAGNLSKWVPLESGTPQGSPLSALLFTLFTHDLPHLFKNRCKYHVYADDVQLYIHCKPSELNSKVAVLNEVIKDVSVWCDQHGLKLNPNKTQVLVIGSENQYHRFDLASLDKIMINDVVVDYSEKVKNLGLVFDKNFSWNGQISAVTQKVYGVLNNINKFRDVTPEKTRIQLVKSLIMPHFDYCDIVYCNISAEQIHKLQVLQNNAVRYIYDVKRGDRLNDFYKKCNMIKVEDRRNLHILTQTHKILYKNGPEYLNDFATTLADVRIHSERESRSHKMKLLAPFVSVEVPESCFKVKCYRLWNNLPPTLCLNPNLTAVKKILEEQILKSY